MLVNDRFLLACVCSLALGACAMGNNKAGPEIPVEEADGPSVVVVMKGKKSAKLRRAIEDALEIRYEIVPSRRYRTVASRLKAKKMKTRNVARVASKLGVSAVVQVTLRRKGKKRYVLKLRLRDGASGKTVERFTMKLRSRKLRDRDEDKFVAMVSPVLDDLIAAAAGEVDESEDEFDGDEEVIAARSTAAEKEDEVKEDEEDEEILSDDSWEEEEEEEGQVSKRRVARKSASKKTKEAPARVARRPVPAKKAKPVKVAKRPAPARKPPVRDKEAEEKEAVDLDIRYDREGQAIDDEVPAALSKKR